MCVLRLVNAVTTTHGGRVAKQSFGDKCVPKLELGNEGGAGDFRTLSGLRASCPSSSLGAHFSAKLLLRRYC